MKREELLEKDLVLGEVRVHTHHSQTRAPMHPRTQTTMHNCSSRRRVCTCSFSGLGGMLRYTHANTRSWPNPHNLLGVRTQSGQHKQLVKPTTGHHFDRGAARHSGGDAGGARDSVARALFACWRAWLCCFIALVHHECTCTMHIIHTHQVYTNNTHKQYTHRSPMPTSSGCGR